MRFALLVCGALLPILLATAVSPALATSSGPITQGRLDAIGSGGKPLGFCPLKHTAVTVDVSGFIARVTVRQQFHNPFAEKIEAVYVFPLSQDAAVDRMTMKVGDRIVKGAIKERGEARAIYESAKAAGKVASLLDQERPNIFTQSAANIEPGEEVDISISYSETLDWKDGEYQFDFPMVVGPRYIPGGGSAPGPMTPGVPTSQVPDADRITPPITPEATRSGHDISITVNLNAGLPLQRIDSLQHAVTVDYPTNDRTRAVITLGQKKSIPNKDFVLVYETATDKIEDTLLAYTDERGKFFTLVLQPPKRVRKQLIVPKEIVFVIDKSGSMRGFPIDTAKEAMRLCIQGLHENDTFNLMTFEGGVGFCFDRPVPNTDANRQLALQYLASLQGSGGTEMMKAIDACLAGQDDPYGWGRQGASLGVTLRARAAAPANSARMYRMARPTAEMANGERAEDSLRGVQAQSLENQLNAMDMAGKSDDEKKPIIERLLKIKLAAELQGLAEKVANEGSNGNLTIGNIRVTDGRVDIRVQLTSTSDEVLAMLKKLGFKELARAKVAKLLIGTIDVRQLEALAKLAEVRRIDPLS